VGYLNNPNNFLRSIPNDGTLTGVFREWGINTDNGYPTPYVTDAYGNGMMAKNVDRVFKNTGAYRVFMPHNTNAERNAAFKYASNVPGVSNIDGYEWNTSNDGSYTERSLGPQGSNAYFWANTAAYPTDSGFCWNGSPGYISWGTPPACPAGFTDNGVVQAVVVSYLDWGTGANAGGGALTPANLTTRHASISWQFYQYFTWGCGSPGYPYFGASVRYCQYLSRIIPYS
jgi:hypothetical protein